MHRPAIRRSTVLGIALACWIVMPSALASPPKVGPSATTIRPEVAGQRIAERGMKYLKRGKHRRALAMFEKALPLRPADPQLLGAMVQAAQQLGRKDRVLLYGYGYMKALEDEKLKAEARMATLIEDAVRGTSSKSVEVVIKTLPAGVRITIDHVRVGRSPVAGLRLMPGRYTVRGIRRAFEPAHEPMVLVAKEPTHLKTLRMVPKNRTGLLRVKTDPEQGVTIQVDGQPVGVTPIDKPLRLVEGKRLVVFTRPGYEMWQRYVRIRESRTTTLEPVLERRLK